MNNTGMNGTAEAVAMGAGVHNVGVEKATDAARKINAKVAILQAIDGKALDFNDMHKAQGAEAVRAAIGKAESPRLPIGYFYNRKDRGALYYEKRDAKGEVKETIRICPHVEVLGITHGSAKFGYLLRWADRLGDTHTRAIPASLFQQQGSALAETLAADGLEISQGQQAQFRRFVMACNPRRTIRNVSKVGWYADSYVLPDCTITGGGGREEIALQTDGGTIDRLYMTAGTLEEWQKTAELCAGNSMLVLGLCVAFAAPLLDFTGQDGCTFNLMGASSIGKSSIQKIAASVWGYPPEHIKSWRVTDNGFETLCPLFNDNLLSLDELGTVTGRALESISYMFSLGTGKTRANRAGGYRIPHVWRATLLSSGEISLSAKLNEDGRRARAGQSVRFIDVPITKDHIQNIHGRESSGAYIDEIKTRSEMFYGTAGRAFLKALTADLARVKKEIVPAIDRLALSLLTERADSQVRRVAARFALACYGGELAQEFGILPEALDIRASIFACFDAWLNERGTLGAAEDAAILDQVRLFIEMHGASRFQDPEQDELVINRAGYRPRGIDAGEYWLLPKTFEHEIIKGFTKRRAVEALYNAGWIKRPYAELKKIRGQAMRVYVLTLPEIDEE